MHESLIKYLAGLLDADGSLSFTYRADRTLEGLFFPALRLSLASSKVIDHDGFVEGLVKQTGMGSFREERGQFYYWTVVKSSDLEKLLPRVIKHMVIKARHWKWLYQKWKQVKGTLLTEQEREELTAACKKSRTDRTGPLRAKNHPTWAWTAGFMDGDGWYRMNYDAKQNYWEIKMGAVAHRNDAHVLKFLQTAYGGHIYEHGQSKSCLVWKRSIGVKDRSFALRFLPNVTKHSRLKRHKIDQIIHHHQQRLSDPSPTG